MTLSDLVEERELREEMAETCGDLVAFVDGELGDERAAEFRAHLQCCERCRLGVADELWLSSRLSVLGEEDLARGREVLARAKVVVTGPWWWRACVRAWWWLRRQ